jgi:protein arginine kinase activator
MECDFCHEKATVFLTQLVEGKVKKVKLCEKCAKEKGVTDPTGFALADMLLGEGADEEAVVAQIAEVGSGTKSCPECGFALADLKRVRRFGCPACYQAFHAEVEMMLRGMHAGARHIGKAPKGQLERGLRKKRLEQLRKRLDQAVAAEKYEEAAGLRDEIREIEAESGED